MVGIATTCGQDQQLCMYARIHKNIYILVYRKRDIVIIAFSMTNLGKLLDPGRSRTYHLSGTMKESIKPPLSFQDKKH